MIKFFRKIRQNLLSEGKTGKYLKYAFGEIILVVVGILIALAINNWNQDRLSNQQQKAYLNNLKEELATNIEMLQRMDSLYKIKKENTVKGIEILKNNPSIGGFLEMDSLIHTLWTTFSVNRSTYDEMLNNGSFYSLQNKELKQQIDKHYTLGHYYENHFSELNRFGQTITLNSDLNKVEVLVHRLKNSPVDLDNIDTTWLHNPNSPVYTGYFKQANFFSLSNLTRRSRIKSFINSCTALIESIDKELANHD